MVRESERKGKPEGKHPPDPEEGAEEDPRHLRGKGRLALPGGVRLHGARGNSPPGPGEGPSPPRHDRRGGPGDPRARRPSWASRTTPGWIPRSSSGATAWPPSSRPRSWRRRTPRARPSTRRGPRRPDRSPRLADRHHRRREGPGLRRRRERPVPANGHYLLGVHIADVSHYVRPGTALDGEAFARATSVYFPDLTLPMLPERLSNDLCSLRPRVPRLTVSVLLEIDGAGRVVREEFHPSVIQTVERMTYTSVFRDLRRATGPRARQYAHVVPALLLMRDLARLLRAKRAEAGSLDFDLLEPELVYKEGTLTSIVPTERNEANQLIEEFMVAANVAVAASLSPAGVPALYRIHPAPAEVEDLEKLRELLGHFGLVLPRGRPDRSPGPPGRPRADEGTAGRKVRQRPGPPLAEAGRLLGREPRPLRPRQDGLHPLHLAHPALPGPRRPPRPEAPAGGKQDGEGFPWPLGPPLLPEGAAGGRGREGPPPLADLPFPQDEAGRRARRGSSPTSPRPGSSSSWTTTSPTGSCRSSPWTAIIMSGGTPRPCAAAGRGRTFDLGDRVRVVLVACDPALRRMEFSLSPEMGGKA